MIFAPFQLKQQAKKALKLDLHTAIMITFLALLPSLLSQTALTIATLPMQDITQMWQVELLNNGTLPDVTQLPAQLAAAIGQKQLIAFGVALLLCLVQPVLELGWLSCLMRFLRGETPATADVLCRKDCFFKAIGLAILRVLKIMLWMLPGYIAYGVLFALAMVFNMEFLVYLASAAVFASSVLGIRASLHYSMVTYVLADHPETPLLACFRKSVSIMRYRKMMYVMLLISFVGWMLLLSLTTELLASISVVIGITAQLLLSLPLNLYRCTTVCAFYEGYKDQPSEPPILAPMSYGDVMNAMREEQDGKDEKDKDGDDDLLN